MTYTALYADPRRPQPQWAKPAQSIDNLWKYGSVNERVVGTTAAAAWPTANLIIYIPVQVKTMVVAKKLWFANTTTSTGNIDIGIYSRAGARLISSGSTAKISAGAEQVLDITDTLLRPDLYYLALQCSNNTDTFQRVAPAAPNLAASGVRTEAAGALPLPATATWVVAQTLAYDPIVGMFLETTPT